jgi:hypothetical protein
MTSQRQEIDMSPEAIDKRLRDVGQLYRLGMSLKSAKLIGPVNGNAAAEDADSASAGNEIEKRDGFSGQDRAETSSV